MNSNQLCVSDLLLADIGTESAHIIQATIQHKMHLVPQDAANCKDKNKMWCTNTNQTVTDGGSRLTASRHRVDLDMTSVSPSRVFDSNPVRSQILILRRELRDQARCRSKTRRCQTCSSGMRIG